MFDQKEIEAYRSIKAPSALKNRITADCEAERTRGKRNIGGAFPTQGLLRSLSAVAACFVLAVAIFSLTRMNTEFVTLSYEGTTLTDAKTVVSQPAVLSDSMAREITPMGIRLAFDTKGEAKITVSGGCLYAMSENGEEIVSLGSETEITEDTVLWWAVVEGLGNYELTVNANDKQTVFVLELNENTPDGVIYKK